MNPAIDSLICSRLPINGLAAYGFHRGQQAAEIQLLSKSIYPTSTEQMLCRLVRGAQELLPSSEHPAQYCWTFECHRVYVAARTDGGCLAMLVENNPRAQLSRVQDTLQAFLDLPELS
jgi:hypothetical protein